MIEKTDKQSNLTVFGKIYFTVIYLDLLLSFASMFVPSIPMTLLVHIMVGLGLGFVAYLAMSMSQKQANVIIYDDIVKEYRTHVSENREPKTKLGKAIKAFRKSWSEE